MKATDVPRQYVGLGESGSWRVVQIYPGEVYSPTCARHEPWSRRGSIATLVDDHTGKSTELCRQCCQALLGIVPAPVDGRVYFGVDLAQSVEAKFGVEEVSIEEMRAELAGVKCIAAMTVRRKRPAIGHVMPRKAVIGRIVTRRKH